MLYTECMVSQENLWQDALQHIEFRDSDASDEDCRRTDREIKNPMTGKWEVMVTASLDVEAEYKKELLAWLLKHCLVYDGVRSTWRVQPRQLYEIDF